MHYGTYRYITVMLHIRTSVHHISQGNGHRLECRIATRDHLILVPLAETLKYGGINEICWSYAIAEHADDVVDVHQRRFDRLEREWFPVLTHDGHLKSIRGWSPNRIRRETYRAYVTRSLPSRTKRQSDDGEDWESLTFPLDDPYSGPSSSVRRFGCPVRGHVLSRWELDRRRDVEREQGESRLVGISGRECPGYVSHVMDR